MVGAESSAFAEFAREARPRLVRAFVGVRGDDAPEAAAEALVHAWEHWDEVNAMANPMGYLFRVGQTRTRRRRVPVLPRPESVGLPEVEPRLVPALLQLPDTQRAAVWLVHACQWRYSEVAEALGTTTSMVGNHVNRALSRLRRELEVNARA